jgi:hypothetical protein
MTNFSGIIIHARQVKRSFYASTSGHVYRDENRDVNRNLCGAAPTAYDITPAQARKFKDTGDWKLCPTCREKA